MGSSPSPMTASVKEADEAFFRLSGEFLAHGRETPALLQSVLAADPDHVLGWSAKAMFAVMLGQGELLPCARDAAMRAATSLRRCGGGLRETAYAEAAERLTAGDWLGGVAAIERALDADPSDSMAAKISHGVRFMIGDREGMLASIERVIARVGLQHPHSGFLLGCKSFALEENGRCREAEFIGRSAVDREPRDAWGMHAVSHSHEMTGRPEEGVRWLEGRRGAFTHCNNFRFHLFWHLALFRLDLGDIAGVLDLYDTHVRGERTDDFRDIANAASLLQRLELDGVDVGSRWEELGEACAGRVQDRTLVFADLHYVMALAGAGRGEAASAIIDGLSGSAPRWSALQVEIAAKSGAAAARGVLAWREGRHGDAAELMLKARADLPGVGGSHAQRDVFEQILIDSAVRSAHPMAQALLLNRLARRGGRNAFAKRRLEAMARAGARQGAARLAR